MKCLKKCSPQRKKYLSTRKQEGIDVQFMRGKDDEQRTTRKQSNIRNQKIPNIKYGRKKLAANNPTNQNNNQQIIRTRKPFSIVIKNK